MALMRPGPMLTGVSGSLGPLTYRVGPQGGYVGLRSKGPRTRTAATRAARSTFRSAVDAWHGLTPAQRAAWNDWAADWGTLADPPRPALANGYARFIASTTARALAGLGPLSEPDNPGYAGASRAYLDYTPRDDGSGVDAVMLVPLPPQPGTPVRVLVSMSPVRSSAATANYSDAAFRVAFDPQAGQPGEFAPPLAIPGTDPTPPGSRRWAMTRMVDSAGYVGRPIVAPVLTVPPGHRRAFKVRPSTGDIGRVFLTRTPSDEVVLRFRVSETDVELAEPLGASGLLTVGDVADWLGGLGILELRAEVPAVYARSAFEIPVFGPVRLTLYRQPFPVPVPAP